LNEWHGAATPGGRARIFESPKFKAGKRDMAMSFAATRPAQPIDYPVDLVVEVSLWKRIDSDAPVKAIMDALELGGVLKDDKLVRDILTIRAYHHRDETDTVEVRLYETGARRMKHEEGA
jgi:Holliday junction resolvase RusA-like endonuclease